MAGHQTECESFAKVTLGGYSVGVRERWGIPVNLSAY